MGKILDFESFQNKLRLKYLILKKPPVCTWTEDSDLEGNTLWLSGCGELYMLNDGDPKSNRVHFCHGCGGALIVKKKDDIIDI